MWFAFHFEQEVKQQLAFWETGTYKVDDNWGQSSGFCNWCLRGKTGNSNCDCVKTKEITKQINRTRVAVKQCNHAVILKRNETRTMGTLDSMLETIWLVN